MLVLALAFVACVVVFAVNDGPLRTDVAPRGIVSLEVAGSGDEAAAIVDSWAAEDALDEAGFSIGFDYVFLAVYSTGLAALCSAAAGAFRRRGMATASRVAVLGWAAWLAAMCDAIENVAMLRLLDHGSDSWAGVARGFATVKFALIVVILAALLVSAIVVVIRRDAAV